MAFDKNSITVTTGAAVTLIFNNKDTIPHNFALYTNSSATPVDYTYEVVATDQFERHAARDLCWADSYRANDGYIYIHSAFDTGDLLLPLRCASDKHDRQFYCHCAKY